MLRKILLVLVLMGMMVPFGCKKTSTDTQTKNTVTTKQAVKDGQTTTETVKKEVIKETETPLDANAK